MTGKPGGLDLREHKVTLPLIAALAARQRPTRARIDDAVRAPRAPTTTLIADVIAIVSRRRGGSNMRGGGASSLRMTRSAALRSFPKVPVRAALTDAIAYVMERRS